LSASPEGLTFLGHVIILTNQLFAEYLFELQNYDIQAANCDVYAISAGNLPALCLLLEKVVTPSARCARSCSHHNFQDPEEELKELYPLLLQGMHQSPCSQPLYGYCGDLSPVPTFTASLSPTIFLCHIAFAHRRGQVRRVLDAMLDSSAHVRATGR
jgi:hypothetical protein